MATKFFRALFLLLLLNAIIKPVWIFGIDRNVQLITGTNVYGKYFALFGLTMVFNFLIDLGITIYYNRRAAADNNYLHENFIKAASLKVLLSVFYALILILIGFISGWDDWKMMYWLIINQVMLSFLLFFRANITSMHHYTVDAFFSVLDKLIVVLTCGLFIYFPARFGQIDIYMFVYLQVLGAALAMLSAFVYVLLKGKIRLSKGIFHLAYLKETLPYAVLIFLMAAHNRIDAFLLERLHPNGAYEAGVYAKAFRLLDAANMAGYLTAGFMLPYLSKHIKQQDVKVFVNRILHVLMLIAILLSSAAIVFPEWIDQFLYHTSDNYTALILSLCIPVIIFYYWIHIFGCVLTAAGVVKQFTFATIILVLLNTILNVVLIPHYGAKACAIVALVSQGLYAIAIYILAQRHTYPIVNFSQMIKYLAILLLAVGLLFCGKLLMLNVPIAISSAFMLTLIVAIILKMFSIDDIKALIKINS